MRTNWAPRIERLESRHMLAGDLLAHWTMDDADVVGNAVRDTAAAVDGPFDGAKTNGGPTTGVAGVVGQAAQFAGGASNGNNQFIDLSPHAATFGALGQGTIAAWVKPDTTGLQTDVLSIFTVSNGAAASEEMRFWVSNGGAFGTGTLAYGVRAGTVDGSLISSASNLLDGNWHHVAVSIGAGNSAQLYVDGNATGSAGVVSFLTGLSANASAIGRNRDSTAGGGQWFFDGLIDDVGLWQQPRTAAEIKTLESLATNATLNYDLAQAQQLFDLHRAASGSTSIAARTWSYVGDGLSGAPGVVVDEGGGAFSINFGGGSGVRTGVAPLRVTSTDPVDGEFLAAPPATITVTFSDNVSAATVNAGDLTVDGSPATGVTPLGTDRLVFELPAVGSGSHTVAMAQGALTSVDGAPLDAYSGAFVVPTAPQIAIAAASNVGPNVATLGGEVLATGGQYPMITIYWGNDDAGQIAAAWDNSISIGPAALGAFAAQVSGLAPQTQYFFRATAENVGGQNWTATAGTFITASLPNLLVTEFMADNEGSLLDEDGAASDWIEIYNPSPLPVDLAGWRLTDDPAQLAKWTFPSVVVAPGGYLIVFASSKDRAASGEPLHTNFGLRNNGEYVALVRPDSAISSEHNAGGVDYPQQFNNVSYGLRQEAQTLVAAGATAHVLVPTSAAELSAAWNQASYAVDANWTSGPSGVGFATDTGGSQSGLVGHWNLADGSGTVATDSSPTPAGGTANDGVLVNYADAAADWNADLSGATDGVTMPHGLRFSGGINGSQSNYVDLSAHTADFAALQAGTISTWFRRDAGASPNDHSILGFGRPQDQNYIRIQIENGNEYVVSEVFADGTGTTTHMQGPFVDDGNWHHVAFTSDGASSALFVDGVHVLSGMQGFIDVAVAQMNIGRTPRQGLGLWYFDGTIGDVRIYDRVLAGDSGLNAAVLGGSELAYIADATHYGDGLSSDGNSLAEFIATDVADAMLGPGETGVNGSAFLRFEFDVTDAAFETLSLAIRYDAGFVAYLNGVEVARRNAPASTEWNAVATAERSDQAAIVTETIDLSTFVDVLATGENVLAIHGLNGAADNGDFLILPELTATVTDLADRLFFTTPTPGARNGDGFAGVITEGVIFSATGGTFTSAFDLTLTPERPTATMRYTLDGSTPSEASPVYAGPISITGTTQVRARLFEANFAPGPVESHSFLHLAADVQSFTSPLPILILDNFGGGAIPNKRAAGGAVGDGGGVVEVERKAATMSIIGLSGLSNAITTAADLSTRVGIRVRGASSANFAKQSLSVETWGSGDDDSSVSPFAMPAESDWVLYGPSTEFDDALIHNSFIYELSNQIGRYAVRFQFVEVFLNTGGGSLSMADHAGLYLFMESIKRDDDRVQIDTISADGSTGGWMVQSDRLQSIPVGSTEHPPTFHTKGPNRIQEGPYGGSSSADRGGDDIPTGYNTFMNYEYPRGEEINAAQENVIRSWFDEFEDALYGPDFADPLLGYRAYIDVDSFVDHLILNNVTKNRDGLQLSTYMYREDETSLLQLGPIWDFDRAYNSNSFGGGATGSLTWGQQFLWMPRLFEDPDFAQAYVDRWQELRDGPFSTASFNALIDAQAAEITPAVAAANGTTNWAGELQAMKDWLATRTAAIDSLYVAPPLFDSPGGQVDPGFELLVTAARGTVYYTVDGSDPRASGGGVAPGAVAVGAAHMTTLVDVGAAAAAIVPDATFDAAFGTSWTGLPASEPFDDSTVAGWKQGTSGVGYDLDPDYLPLIGLDVGAEMNLVNTSVYTRINFDVAGDPSAYDFLTLRMQYDDGFVAYLNGVVVASANAPATLTWDSASSAQQADASAVVFETFDLTPHLGLLHGGENVLAIHGLNRTVDSTDMLLRPVLEAGVFADSVITIDATANIVARALDGGSWSGPTTGLFTVDAAPALAITELHYNPAGTQDTEFVELRNTGTTPLDISGFTLTGVGGTPDFVFPAMAPIAAGGFVLVVRNVAAFEAAYGTGLSIAGQYAGGLDNGGEMLGLFDAIGAPIQAFTFDDAWYAETDGEGFSLVAIDVAGDYNVAINWRSSALVGGSPGAIDPTPQPGDFDGNGVVDRTDAAILAAQFGRDANSHRGRGDADGDGRTTLSDLAIVQLNMGRTLAAPSPNSAASSLVAAAAVVDRTRDVRGTRQLTARRVNASTSNSIDSAPSNSAPSIGSHLSGQRRAERRGLRVRRVERVALRPAILDDLLASGDGQ
ncbi:MAG: LamG-like jellyroll fold domain-containing protein [Pirellulales bacterium]